MPKLVNLSDRRRSSKKSTGAIHQGGYSFQEEVDSDIDKLCENLDINREEAVKVATDFFRKYPALMHHVMNPNHLLRGR